jgi:hypothetical protein
LRSCQRGPGQFLSPNNWGITKDKKSEMP